MSRKKVRIFIQREWRQTDERLLPLARFLFGLKEQALPTFRDEFVHNMQFDSVEWVANLQDADFAFVPVNWSTEVARKYPKLIVELAEASSRHDKPVVLESYTKDIDRPESIAIPFKQGIYLNSSLLRSLSPPNFLALPYFIPDCLDRYYSGNLTLLEKSEKPAVGFCGVAAPLKTPFNKTKLFDIGRLILTIVDDVGGDSDKVARFFRTNTKHAHRSKALLHLQKSSKVDLDCILRSEGGFLNNAYTNLDDFDEYNTEFYENLNRNLYSLCSRGTENYSIRFFETFCMGRVPVLIDTDILLPFESKIDYGKQCVLVEKSQVKKLDEIVLKFNSSHTGEQLKELQATNREIWETYFSHENFWYQLVNEQQAFESNSTFH